MGEDRDPFSFLLQKSLNGLNRNSIYTVLNQRYDNTFFQSALDSQSHFRVEWNCL